MPSIHFSASCAPGSDPTLVFCPLMIETINAPGSWVAEHLPLGRDVGLAACTLLVVLIDKGLARRVASRRDVTGR
jgi:hypothetical protein